MSGTLTTTKYAKDNWDSEAHAPNENAEYSSKVKLSLDGVEYGQPLETTNKTMLDLSKYFVTGLNSSVIEFSNFVTNPTTGMPIYSEGNKVYPNEPIDCPVDFIKENNAYTPSTALDVSTLYITGCSVEDFLSLDNYGWTVTGAVGDKAIIYIGNSYNDKLAEVEVEVVASPVKTKANLSPNIFFVTQAENNNYAYDGSGGRPTLTINTSETITLAISTNNSGPFDELGVGFWFSKTGVASAKLVSDQVDYYHISKNAVYFEITAVSSGECVFAITDAATREGIFEISLIVNLD